LRKGHDTGAAAAGDQELESQKTEETYRVQVQVQARMIGLQIRMRSSKLLQLKRLLLLRGGRPDGQGRP
jgi:hypothetical protein